MNIKLGNKQFEVNFDEVQNNITVDGITAPVVHKSGWAFKCYKRPRYVAADGGIKALKKFFEDDLFLCYQIAICEHIKTAYQKQAKTEARHE